MIIKDILSKKWEKIQTLTSYFLVILSISFILITTFLLIYPITLPLQKNTTSEINLSSSKNKDLGLFSQSSFWAKDNSTSFINTPPIEKRIFFVGANTRPDCKEKSVALTSDQNKIVAKLHETIYINCKNPKNFFFTDKETPFTLSPLSFDKETLKVQLTTTYKNSEGKIVHKHSIVKTLNTKNKELSKISSVSASACKSLSRTQFLGPDKLLSLFGGKKLLAQKDSYRLLFKNNATALCLFIKKGDTLQFINNEWVKTDKIEPKKPLFHIYSISSRSVIGTFWNENGFFKKEYTIPITRRGNTNVHTFGFKKIYKRSNDSVICKIKDRTFLLKPNDWLIKKNSTWHTIKSISELNNIVDLNTFHELIIFDSIIKDKEKEIFIGYIFDKTRSNYKKLEIPLKQKEKLRYTK